MAKINRGNSIQNPFLDWMIQSMVPVDIWMDSGQHLEGVVASYDWYSIMLRSPSGKKERLLVKNQVSAIRPKEVPVGRMERLITAPRRINHRPLDNFKHPIDPD